MNFRLEVENPVAAEHERQCRRKLAKLRVLRSRAADALLDLCRELQKDPASLDPLRMSAVLAEVRYLEGRTQQLERFLVVIRKSGSGGESDF